MPLLDVSQVTRTLITVLESAIETSSAWSSAQTLDVVPSPPDELSGNNQLGLYLYHMMEDPKTKNMYVSTTADTPVRFAPMGLTLYYIMSSHSTAQGDEQTYREQLMMGLAAKAFHDYPMIDDDTRIGGTQVIAPLIRGAKNRIRITMQPVPHERAVHYYTAGQTPLRLSLYYEVSVVLLEPEEITMSGPPVLAYGIQTFVSGAPRLDTTRNEISFTVPDETEPRRIVLSPARATYDDTVTVRGSGFTGDRKAVLLRRADAVDYLEMDSAWSVDWQATSFNFIVQSTASGVDIIPVIYALMAEVTTIFTLPDGRGRKVGRRSNEIAFAVTPRIDTVSAPDAQGRSTITGGIYQHPDIAPETIEIFLGDAKLSVGSAPLNSGEYRIVSATEIEIRTFTGSPPTEMTSLRLIVNGAEGAMRFIG